MIPITEVRADRLNARHDAASRSTRSTRSRRARRDAGARARPRAPARSPRRRSVPLSGPSRPPLPFPPLAWPPCFAPPSPTPSARARRPLFFFFASLPPPPRRAALPLSAGRARRAGCDGVAGRGWRREFCGEAFMPVFSACLRALSAPSFAPPCPPHPGATAGGVLLRRRCLWPRPGRPARWSRGVFRVGRARPSSWRRAPLRL